MANVVNAGFLSGGAGGIPIKVATNSNPGTLIHAVSSAVMDAIWLYAVNTSGTDCVITVLWGGTTEPDCAFQYSVANKDGMKCIVPGLRLGTGLSVKIYASVANVINILGYADPVTAT